MTKHIDVEAIRRKCAERSKKIFYKKLTEKYEVGREITIGKKGGAFFEKINTIRYEEGRRIILQYNGKFPNIHLPIHPQEGKVDIVDDHTLNIIEDAIDSFSKCKHYHLNSYDFIVTYCLVKGVDLIEMGIIDL